MSRSPARCSPAAFHPVLGEKESDALFVPDDLYDPIANARRRGTRLLITVLLFMGGGILLLRLNTSTMPKHPEVWTLPHAVHDVGPNPKECAQRTLQTRTGIALPKNRFHLRESTPVIGDATATHEFYIVNVKNKEKLAVRLPADVVSYQFFPESNLPPLSFT